MNRCEHGIYLPDGDTSAWGCTTCFPQGHPEVTDAPQFNRRGALTLTSTGKLPKCPNCNNTSILAVSNDGVCRHCGSQYEIVSSENMHANNKQNGSCACGCGIHYEVDKKTWKCADCGELYSAPKLKYDS